LAFSSKSAKEAKLTDEEKSMKNKLTECSAGSYEKTRESSLFEFGSRLTEQNMLNYFTFMFNEEPLHISPIALDKWKELPRMIFTHIQNN
jgi:hypothetical protein